MFYMSPSEETPQIRLLRAALGYYSQEDLASALGVKSKTIRWWLASRSTPRAAYIVALQHLLTRDERPKTPDFTFVDLFAGIGGLRRGFESQNGRCVFTSEWDKYARKTYKASFPDEDEIGGDITKIEPEDVPAHDLLLAGFPCQPFSLAGVSKKNSLGRAHGFLDKTQGTLFFNLVRILAAKQPSAFLLENVKNLRSHDGKRTFQVIIGALEELGYTVFDRVIDARAWVPQHRERVFIAGFRAPVEFDFSQLRRPAVAPTLGEILHRPDEEPEDPFTLSVGGRTVVSPRYTLSDHLWGYLQGYAEKHRLKGNGFGCSVFSEHDVARTLSARYHKDGSEILIAQPRANPRRLTPRECARLMGFDAPGEKRMPIVVSDTQAYRQFGNAVVVPLVRAIAEIMVPRIMRPADFPPNRVDPNQAELPLGELAA